MKKNMKKTRTSMNLDPIAIGGMKILKKYAVVDSASQFVNDLVYQLLGELAKSLMITDEEIHDMAYEAFEDDRREYVPRKIDIEIIKRVMNPLRKDGN